MRPRLLQSPVAAIALTGALSVASASCLVSSDLPAADAAPKELIMTRSNADTRPLAPERHAVGRWLAALQQRRAEDLHALDDRTLRDIGLTRGELASVEAESSGSAPLTRLRIALQDPRA